MTAHDYLLGHDAAEVRRLEDQARVLGPATRTILTLAGIEPGMRVLDLGCGPGDVAFEVAGMVGDGGSVVGIDRSPDAIARARRRAAEAGVDATFVAGDLVTAEVDGPFDAVVGRLVLLYVPDPAVVLKRYAALVRRGGVVVAMEYEMTAAGSLPRLETMDRVVSWIVESFASSGLDPMLGARLRGVLTAAGLDAPSVVGLQGYLEPDDPVGPHMASGIIRTLLPVLVRTGIATEAEVGIDRLAERIADELMSNGAMFKPPTLVGAWARVT